MFVRVNLAMAHRRVRNDAKKNEMTKQELKTECFQRAKKKKTRLALKALSFHREVLFFRFRSKLLYHRNYSLLFTQACS